MMLDPRGGGIFGGDGILSSALPLSPSLSVFHDDVELPPSLSSVSDKIFFGGDTDGNGGNGGGGMLSALLFLLLATELPFTSP